MPTCNITACCMQHGDAVVQGLGQAILEASSGTHQEAMAQAIAHAFSTPYSPLEDVYTLALITLPGCCEQCTSLVPVLTRAWRRCLFP
jgi:hypothetical protein